MKKSNIYNNKWLNFFIKNHTLNLHINNKLHPKSALMDIITITIIHMDMVTVILMVMDMDIVMVMVMHTMLNLHQSNKILPNHQLLYYHQPRRLFFKKFLKHKKKLTSNILDFLQRL